MRHFSRAAEGRGRAIAQKGSVLFFTLIALVAMTLAALAMVRSVDTGNLVAGNIALKQGAIQEADRIMNTAFSCLDSGGALLAVGMDTTVATCNYYAFQQPDALKPFGVPDVLEAVAGSLDAATGFTSSFVIERLCAPPAPAATTGPWVETDCIASPYGRAVSVTDRGKAALVPPQALYRVSVKISGPRNVATYSQMVMNAGI